MMKIKGVRALDELAGPNKGKIRLLSRADEKKVQQRQTQWIKTHSRERATTTHEMTTEEARDTEVGITRTERGRYGNAHIRYDINDGLVDVILEVTPTEEQRAEGIREQKDQKGKRTMTMTEETEHEIKEKYRPRRDEGA
jgi:hypothetical protein